MSYCLARVQTSELSTATTLDARFLRHQQQMLLEQQRQLLLQQQQLATRQQEMIARRPTTPSYAVLSTISDAAGVSSYQMHSTTLTQHDQLLQHRAPHSGTVALSQTPNLMAAAQEIRVDCIQLTTNGRYVVTGSVYGPPQVWDLKVANHYPSTPSPRATGLKK